MLRGDTQAVEQLLWDSGFSWGPFDSAVVPDSGTRDQRGEPLETDFCHRRKPLGKSIFRHFVKTLRSVQSFRDGISPVVDEGREVQLRIPVGELNGR